MLPILHHANTWYKTSTFTKFSPSEVSAIFLCSMGHSLHVSTGHFLEISPRRHLISWSSLVRRHFEGGQISRAATKVLVTLPIVHGLWASVRIVRYLESMSIYITYVMRAFSPSPLFLLNNNDDPLPHAARIRGRQV